MCGSIIARVSPIRLRVGNQPSVCRRQIMWASYLGISHQSGNAVWLLIILPYSGVRWLAVHALFHHREEHVFSLSFAFLVSRGFSMSCLMKFPCFPLPRGRFDGPFTAWGEASGLLRNASSRAGPATYVRRVSWDPTWWCMYIMYIANVR